MTRPSPRPHPLATQEGVYGVILVSGMIVVSGTHSSEAWDVFFAVVTTVIVFWAAHVYAAAVAHHRARDGHFFSFREAMGFAFRRSWGLLVAALIPSSILLLGATRAVPDAAATWSALWVGVGVLAVIGYAAFRARGSSPVVCLLGAAGTAAFGIVMIGLKAVAH